MVASSVWLTTLRLAYQLKFMSPEFAETSRLRATPWLDRLNPQAGGGGAAEELGTPAFRTGDRAGWLGCGHVGRVDSEACVDAGWLFLALKTSHGKSY
jgi:hypothetical protein